MDSEVKRKLREFQPHVWHPFEKDDYRYAWRKQYLIGVIKEFFRDVSRCHQRVWKGYCDYDLFSIFDWFLEIIRPMLLEFKETRNGSPLEENNISHAMFLDDKERDQDIHKDWDAVLDRMISLFGEANEASCSRNNPFEEDYMKAFSDVQDRTRNESEAHTGVGTRVHFPDEYPEYKELAEKYIATEKELRQYRLNCKDEAFQLFSKWFYDLWD